MTYRLQTLISMLLIALLPAIAAPLRAQPTSQPEPADALTIHASGTATRIWYSLTTPSSESTSARTYIRSRAVQKNWQEVLDFPNRVLAMATDGNELVVSMDGGEWARIRGNEFVNGTPLLGRPDLLALAADRHQVWTIALITSSMATTAPTTQSSAPTIATTTTKPTATGDYGLFRFDGDQWSLITHLPHQQAAPVDTDFSLLLNGTDPTIASRQSAKDVDVIRWDGANWKSLGQITSPFPIRKMTLLNLDGKSFLWIAADDGSSDLWSNDNGPWKSLKLPFKPTFPIDDCAIAAFNGELCLLAYGGQDQLEEQRYDATGQSIGISRPVESPPNSNGFTSHDLISWSAMALLIVVMLSTSHRGAVLKQVKGTTITLAPLSLRLGAGLIDLWPMYVLVFIAYTHVHHGQVPSAYYADRFTDWATITCLVVYVLHPLIAESIWDRSLGKMFVGLRVVSADGQKPSRGSILLRNLLRVLEGPLLFGLPLLVIYFTPLRQRIGDMIAGTLVVVRNPPPETPDNDPS